MEIVTFTISVYGCNSHNFLQLHLDKINIKSCVMCYQQFKELARSAMSNLNQSFYLRLIEFHMSIKNKLFI